MDDLINEHFFDSQAAVVIHVLGLFLNILSMDVCSTRHWQTSGRLVQKLNVYAAYEVDISSSLKINRNISFNVNVCNCYLAIDLHQ